MKVSNVVLFVTVALFASAIAKPSSKAETHERRARSLGYRNRFQKPGGYDVYPTDQDEQIPAWRGYPNRHRQNVNRPEVNTNQIDQQFVSPHNTQQDIFEDDTNFDRKYANRDDSDDSDDDSDDSDESHENRNVSDDNSDDSDNSHDSNDNSSDSDSRSDSGSDSGSDSDSDSDSASSDDSNDSDPWLGKGNDMREQDDWQSQGSIDDQEQYQQDEIDAQTPMQQYQNTGYGVNSQSGSTGNDWQQVQNLRDAVDTRIGSGSTDFRRNNFGYFWGKKFAPQEQRDKRPMASYRSPVPPSYSCIDICDLVEFDRRNSPDIRSLCDCTNYAVSDIRK